MRTRQYKKVVSFRALYAAVFIVWLLLTLIAFGLVVSSSIHQVEAEFRQHAEMTVAELRDKLKANEAVLTGFASFLGAVDTSDHRSVRHYANSMHSSYSHIHLLEVARRVERQDRRAFERQQRVHHGPGFAIREIGGAAPAPLHKASYRPIVFVWPERPEALKLLGTDLDSIPYLHLALADADARRISMASAPFQLTDGSTAYVMFKSAERSDEAPLPRAEQSFGGPLTALLVIKASALTPATAHPDTGQRLHIAYQGTVVGPALYDLPAQTTASTLEARLFPTLRLQTGDYSTSQPMQLTVERQVRFADLSGQGIKLMTVLSLLTLSLLVIYLRRHYQEMLRARSREAESQFLAFHDPLTGLPNRHLLEDRVQQALAAWRRRGPGFALMFLDLDKFKEINDAHGHEIGDRLLSAVSRRVESVVRESDTVARFGGDEFVILVSGSAGEDDIVAVGRKLLEAVGRPYEFGALTLNVTTSLGISLCPQDGDDFETLLGNADAAMYRVKRSGRNGMSRTVVHSAAGDVAHERPEGGLAQLGRIRLVS